MMRPTGTVIFQIQLLFLSKLLGKLGLKKNPLDPLMDSPAKEHAAKEIKPDQLHVHQIQSVLCLILRGAKCIGTPLDGMLVHRR